MNQALIQVRLLVRFPRSPLLARSSASRAHHDKSTDIYHSYLALAALAVGYQEEGPGSPLLELDPALNVSRSVRRWIESKLQH